MSPQSAAAFQYDVPNAVPAGAQVFSMAMLPTRVRAVAHSSPWMRQLKGRFEDITGLDTGWDGYGGKSVSFGCANFAANLVERLFVPYVPPPELVPGSDGSLQVEWHRRGISVELDILHPYHVVATLIAKESGQIEEHVLTSEFSLVADWIEQLK